MTSQNNFGNDLSLEQALNAFFAGSTIEVTDQSVTARHTDGSGETTLNYGVAPSGSLVLVSVDKTEGLPQEVEVDCPGGGDHTHRFALCAPGASHYHYVA